ncbi:MAG: TerB N-terminal domain-containing protein, partial [Verrucomicrobiota bacterium]
MTPIRFILVIVIPVAAGMKWGTSGLLGGLAFAGLVFAGASAVRRQLKLYRRRILAKPDVVSPPTPRVAGHPQRGEVVTATRPPRSRKLQWIAPGTSVQIAGRTIPGMVYVSDVPLGWDGELSAICRSQPVDARSTWMEDLPYYPCYENLNSNQRANYLDWLERGRRDKIPESLPAGYLFLFFYGIERRVLLEGDRDPALWNEILDLLHTYGLTSKSRSVASYFGDFLHFSAYAMGPARYSDVCPTLLEVQGKSLSETALTLALANLFRIGQPMDWSLAHLVAMNLEDSRRSVVTERTGEEFKSMFRMRFEDAYPGGLSLKASKREKHVRYRNGNNTIAGGTNASAPGLLLAVPGVMGITNQFKLLSSIWNQCIEDLSGYSRAVTRIASAKSVSNQDRMKAYLALPQEIRKEHRHPLAQEFHLALSTCPNRDGISFAPVTALAGLLGFAERPTLTPVQSNEVADLLETLGYTVAPHPRLLNLPLAWTQEIGVAKCTAFSTDDVRLGGLLRLQFLAVLVAAADGVVDENELVVFRQATSVDEEFDRIQIAATEAVLLRDTQIAAKHLPKITKSVPQADRIGVFRLLTHIAGCDDVISSDENRILRKIARAFELGDSALDDVLTEDAAFRTVTVVRGRAATPGESIPGPPME